MIDEVMPPAREPALGAPGAVPGAKPGTDRGRARRLAAALLVSVLAVADGAHSGTAEDQASRVAVGLVGETGIEGGQSYRLPDDLLSALSSPDLLPRQNTGRTMRLLGPRAMARRAARLERAERAREHAVRSWVLPGGG